MLGGSCHHSMVCPRVADGGDSLQIRKVVANKWNRHSQTADKEVVLQLWG